MSTPTLQRRIEIFRAGTFTPMQGGEVTFTEADLIALAEAYDPALFDAPAVVGHPRHDDPAFGWVTKLSVENGVLVADLDQVDAAFADAVAEGRYKKISPSFWEPGAKSNPKPGHRYLKHVGFLGGAAPAVKGLKPVTHAFTEGDSEELTLEFGAPEAAALRSVADLFGRLRDLLIEQFGSEAADKTVPRFEIAWLQDQAAAASADALAEQQAPGIPAPAFSEPNPSTTEEQTMDDTELKKREAAVAAREAKLRKDEDVAFVDGLAAKGVAIAGAFRDSVLAFMEKLDDLETLSFTDGGSAMTRRGAFQEILAALPASVPLGEVTKGGDIDGGSATVSFAAPDGFEVDTGASALHAKALAYQAQNPGTEYLTAVKAVGGK